MTKKEMDGMDKPDTDYLKRIAAKFCDIDALKYVDKNSLSGKWEWVEGPLSEKTARELFGDRILPSSEKVLATDYDYIQFSLEGDDIKLSAENTELVRELVNEFKFEEWPEFEVEQEARVRMVYLWTRDRVEVDIRIRARGVKHRGPNRGIL